MARPVPGWMVRAAMERYLDDGTRSAQAAARIVADVLAGLAHADMAVVFEKDLDE